MPVDIDTAFVQQFETEVHQAFQRKGSMLRNMCRRKTGVKNKTWFQKIGQGRASGKSRHGVVPTMGLDHDQVSCTVTDKFAADYSDHFDELRIQHDERGALSDAAVFALGREADDQVLDAMDASSTSYLSAAAQTFTSAAGPTTLMETIGEANIPFDGQLYSIVPWRVWGDLMNIDEFANSQYIGQSGLPFDGMAPTAKNWLGIFWFPYNGLPLTGTDTKGFIWHKSAVGHATGEEISTTVDWITEKDAWFVKSKMQMGACVIDSTAVIEIVYETT